MKPELIAKNLEQFGLTPLMQAITVYDKAWALRELANPYIDINATDIDGRSALDKAVTRSMHEIASILLLRGATFHRKSWAFFGDAVCQSLARKDVRMLELLLPHTTVTKEEANEIRQIAFFHGSRRLLSLVATSVEHGPVSEERTVISDRLIS